MSDPSPGRIAVMGGGAWGTALAATMKRAGNAVTLWMRDDAAAESIVAGRGNPAYLPGIDLPSGLSATSDAGEALAGARIVLLVVPAQATRAALATLAHLIPQDAPVVLCSKGIERDTGRMMSDIVGEALPGATVACLSGPSFATDLARGLPTAVTVAARDGDMAFRLATRLSGPNLRCYSTDDLTGVELGGALKNVIALAAGVVAGAGLGASAQAAIVTRGFVEIRRLAEAFGAWPETLMGLSGLGDLVLTCNSPQSRNFSYGIALGRGETMDGRPLAEGVATAGIAAQLAAQRHLPMPITDAVDAILGRRMTVAETVEALLSRPLRSET